MCRAERLLLIYLLALLVSPDVLGFSLTVPSCKRARWPYVTGRRRMASTARSTNIFMKADDSVYDG